MDYCYRQSTRKGISYIWSLKNVSPIALQSFFSCYMSVTCHIIILMKLPGRVPVGYRQFDCENSSDFVCFCLSLYCLKENLCLKNLAFFRFFCIYSNKSYEIVHLSTIQKEKLVINLVDSSSPFIGRYNRSPILQQ